MRDKAWGYWKRKENMDLEVMRWRMRLYVIDIGTGLAVPV